MKTARTNQITISEGNHSAGDAIPLGKNVLAYTVKCHPTSPSNIFIGINEDASEGNLLQPSESMTIEVKQDGYYLQDKVYIGFETAGVNGKALVVVTRDIEQEYCP